MQQVPVGGATTESLPAILAERARGKGLGAVSHKLDGRWQELGWAEMEARVQALSAGLVAVGVKPGDRIAVFAATSLQWLICDLAISATRAITVPIYASNTPDEVRYLLNHSGATLLFVDSDQPDAKQAGRLTRVRQRLAECPAVQQVVIFEGPVEGDRERPLAELVRVGEVAHRATPEAYAERVASLRSEDVATILYTSGTTGDPKGVMLTHGNFAYEAQVLNLTRLMLPDDSVMLFLPLAHVFAQVVKASWLGTGYKLLVAESADKLLANVEETQPSILPSVPRVFEKVYNKVVSDGSSAPGVKGTLFRWAMGLFDQYVEARLQGREFSSLQFTLARKLVFSKISATLAAKLGGRLRAFISGGAPLSRKIGYFFDLLGFLVLEGYGLTESTAGATLNLPDACQIGSVGKSLPGGEVKIASDGEILIRGPNIMRGYYQNDAATKEVLEADGWFHSGDIGELDPSGFLRITDRKKDLIVTAGGKNVAPQNLENALKGFPLISQAMVAGDRRPYLTALICVAEEPARKLLADQGKAEGGDYAALSKRPELRAAVKAVVDQLNAQQPPYNTIKQFALMDHDFTQETGELTPTLKVKRKFCAQRYKAELDGLYAGVAVLE